MRTIPPMRTKATLSSFVLVLVLYFVYGWGLVPLVLPNPSSGIAGPGPSGDGYETTRIEIEPFIDLLPPDGWERNSDDIRLLRLGQTIVLFRQDKPEGNRLTLEPCTILILPDGIEDYGSEASREQMLQSVVLRAPKYAEIEFDGDFDLSKMSQLNICTGRLFGTVTVQSGMKDPGTHDDFFLKTEQIIITETSGLTKITTPRRVEFNLGSHSGAGTDLVLELTQSDPSQPKSSKTLSSARFRYLHSLRLVFPEETNVTPQSPGNLGAELATTMDVRCGGPFMFVANPAEQGWTASFHQNVEMERTHPDKSVDRLTAEEVHLTLTSTTPAEKIAAAGNQTSQKNTSQFDALEPTLFVARGKAGQSSQAAVPARLSIAQSGGVTLIGDEIFVDLRKKFLSLSTRKESGASPHVEMILADQYKIRSAQTLQYTLGQNDAFGKFASDGKGDLTGKVGTGTAAKDIVLTWNAMQMEPHPAGKDQIILKLSKGITARMTGFGTMTADSLDLVCDYTPSNVTPSNPTPPNQSKAVLPGAGNQKSNILLDHVIVKENVLFETASGTCRVQQLTIFFINVTADGRELHSRWMPQMLTAAPPMAPPIASFTSPSQSILQVQHLQPLVQQNLIPQNLTQQNLTPMQPLELYTPPSAVVPAPAPAYGNRTPNPLPQSSKPVTGSVETQNLLGMKSSPNGGKFEITGDQMRMRVRIQNGQSFAERVDIEGNVRLKEKPAGNLAGSSQSAFNSGIEIDGNTVMIWNPTDPTTTISIRGHATGGDAIFKGKGVELCARELNISRQDNKFWSPGPGKLIAQTAQINAPGMPARNTESQVRIEWNKEMVCDGEVLQFEGQPGRDSNRVKVLHQTQTLWCNIMEIRLNRKVMFFDDQSTVEPKAVKISFAHDVNVRNLQFDAQGKQTSIDVAKIVHLHYAVEENIFTAEGPGELSSVFMGSGGGFNGTITGNPGNQNNNGNLNYLAVWFLNTMRGTLLDNNKKVDIRGRVEAVYCPAAAWNDTISRENISAARRTGYMLECEQLQIVEVPNPLNLSQSSMELTASTDAKVDGSGVFGKARNIMYNQAKDTIQMDGKVKLETTSQGQRVSHPEAEVIRYNIKTGAVEVIQTQGFGIGQ